MFFLTHSRFSQDMAHVFLALSPTDCKVVYRKEESHVMRKKYIHENKGADQLCSNCAAYQNLCFRYLDSTIPRYFLNPKFQASSHLLSLYSSVCVRPCWKPWRQVYSRPGSRSNSIVVDWKRNWSKSFNQILTFFPNRPIWCCSSIFVAVTKNMFSLNHTCIIMVFVV